MFTYNEAIAYIDSFINYEKTGIRPGKKFSLVRLKKVIDEMKRPDLTYKSVHIAGTKGKGSTSLFTSSILKEAGFNVGLYLSPHLYTVRERISVNNEIIPKEEFASILFILSKYLDSFNLMEFSYFEVLTLAAILYFKQKKVDYAVFECGLGGRLDATNIVEAKIFGFSPISYDHTHILGEKITDIAREKAAIIKDNSYVATARQMPDVLSIIKNECGSKKADLSVSGRDFTYKVVNKDESGIFFDARSAGRTYSNVRVNMPGLFQAENAALAIEISSKAGHISEKGISADAVKRGISSAFIPGRIEVISLDPKIIIDGAQNMASAARLKYSIEQIFKYDKLILLLGVSNDKDIKGISRELGPMADRIIITRSQNERSADPYIIKGFFRGFKTIVTRDVKEGLGTALALAGANDIILATGSFFLISEVARLLSKKQKNVGELTCV